LNTPPPGTPLPHLTLFGSAAFSILLSKGLKVDQSKGQTRFIAMFKDDQTSFEFEC
jgi:hypothetical protein